MSNYDLGRAKGRIELDASGAQRGAKDAQDAIKGVEGQSKNLRAEAQLAGKALMGIGAAALGGIGLAVKAAAGFEQGLSNVKAVTGATEREMDSLRATALRIGRDTAFGAGEATEAMTELAKGGIDVKNIVNGAADATVALAAAGEVAMPRAASIMTAAMTIFKLSGEDAMRAADALAGAANASATDVESLGSALEMVGPSAALLGLSIEDTTVALGALAGAGITGSKAGSTLNRMLLQLTSQTPAAAEAMQELGLMTKDGANAFFDAEGNMKSMSEVAGLLQGAMEGLTKEQQAAYLETIFGSRALAAASAMAELGAEGFDDLAESIGAISAEDVAEEKLNNLSGALTILKGTVETFLIVAGTPFLDFLRTIVEAATEAINWMGSLPEPIVKAAGIFTAAFGTMALAIGSWVVMGSKVTAMGRSFIALFKLLGAALVSPWGLAIAAIAALGYALYQLYQRSESFRDLVHRVAAVLKDVFGKAIERAVEVFGQLKATFDRVAPVIKEVLIDSLKRAADFITGALGSALDWLRETFEMFRPQLESLGEGIRGMVDRFREFGQAISPLIEWIGGKLPGAFTTLWNIAGPIVRFLATLIGDTLRMAINGVIQVFQGAVAIISGILDVFIGLFTGDWSRMWEGVKGIAKGVWDAIVGAIKVWLAVGVIKAVGAGFKAIASLFRGAWNGITGIFSGAMNGIRNAVTGWINGVRTTIQTTKASIQQIITNVWNAIRTFISNVLTGIRTTITNIWQGIQATISTVLAAIRSGVTTVWNAIRALIQTAMAAIRSVITTVWNAIRSTITNVLNGIRTTVQNVWNSIKSLITGAANGARDAAVGAFNRLVSGVGTAIGNLLRSVREIPGKILSALGDLSRLLWDAGKSIIQGLIGGITSMAGKVKDAVGDVLKSARDLLPFSPAKEGPFSGRGWTLYSGRSIVQALAQGVEDEERKARLAAERVAKTMSDALSTSVDFALPSGTTLVDTLVRTAPVGSLAAAGVGGVTRGEPGGESKVFHADFDMTVINPDNAELTRATERALRTVATEWEVN